MESIWQHSAIKLNRMVSIWSWIGRIVPLAYIPASLAYFHYNSENILNTITLTLFIVAPTIAITWWWWAMDTMKWLSHLYTNSLEKQHEIIKELRLIRQEFNKAENDSTRNR